MGSRKISARHAIAAAATTACLAVLPVAVPTAAHAAGGSCWGGPTVKDYAGRVFASRTCPTWTEALVMDDRWPTSPAIGRLFAANNWMVCQAVGRDNPQLGGGRNTYWVYTQGDVSYSDKNGWGWVPATAFTYGGDWQPIPGVPLCAAGFNG
ncbi:hypothetical protein [Streptomyces sp. SID13588]|nr:hypothetical protein [Streptomyces sp. SID13588]